MENDAWAAAQRDADIAEVGPWLDFPASPPWYPPAGGAWAAGVVVASGTQQWWSLPLLLVLFVLAATYFWRARASWGTWPDLRSMPKEFHRPAGVFAVAIGTLVAAGMVVVELLTPLLAAALVGAGVWAVLAWYEGAYADASRRTAVRLGTTSHVR